VREKENSSQGNLSTKKKAGDALRAWITRCHEGSTHSLKNNARPRRMRRRQRRWNVPSVTVGARSRSVCGLAATIRTAPAPSPRRRRRAKDHGGRGVGVQPVWA
jgi:hypothetical protein